jgi:endonuclease G
MVEWWLTRSMLTCSSKIHRTDIFVPDPLDLKGTDLATSYIGSGYDRGHNMPAGDNQCSVVGMDECFYYSNMTPQHPVLNRGTWKDLEDLTRVLAIKNDSIKIYCGSAGMIKKIGKVVVPMYCWKVVHIKKTNHTTAYIFKNDQTSVGDPFNFEVPLAELENKLRYKFVFK